MKFRYQGYNAAAKKVEGEVEANSDAEARNMLRAQRIRPIKLVSKGGAPGKAGAPTDGSGGGLMAVFKSATPSLLQFTAFIRQLATMQAAGIPIVQALSVMAEQVENPEFGKVLSAVQKQIEEGTNLTDALKKYPKVFDRVFLNLVAAGEVSGALDKVLNRLAIFYEKAAQLRRKIVSAMTYPILIVVLVTVVVTILLTFVVPTFAAMFSASGKALPGPTQLVLDISNFVRGNWYFLAMGIGSAMFGVYTLFTNEDSRRTIDPYLMKIPIFGDLIMKISIARFARTLGTMIQSGVPIIDALEITANVAGNYAVETAIKKTRQSITEGNSISGPLAQAKVFPKMAISMIAIGEQTGSLEAMLTKVAEFYEDEVDATVTSLTSILEPMMIVIVGIVVASVLIPMYLPIFKMGDAMGG